MALTTNSTVADTYKFIIQKSSKIIAVRLQGPRTNLAFVAANSEKTETLIDWIVDSAAKYHGIKVEKVAVSPSEVGLEVELPAVQGSSRSE